MLSKQQLPAFPIGCCRRLNIPPTLTIIGYGRMMEKSSTKLQMDKIKSNLVNISELLQAF